VAGVWGAPAPVSAQGGLVSATISGTVSLKSDGSGLSGRTVTAKCSYHLPPFNANYSAITDSTGHYSISALGEVSGSNCNVTVSPCPGSFPFQATARIPPDPPGGVNFRCNS